MYGGETLPVKSPSPAKDAVTACSPTLSASELILAIPNSILAGVCLTPSMVNVTDPDGAIVDDTAGATAAVKTTDSPGITGFAVDTTTVLVAVLGVAGTSAMPAFEC